MIFLKKNFFIKSKKTMLPCYCPCYRGGKKKIFKLNVTIVLNNWLNNYPLPIFTLLSSYLYLFLNFHILLKSPSRNFSGLPTIYLLLHGILRKFPSTHCSVCIHILWIPAWSWPTNWCSAIPYRRRWNCFCASLFLKIGGKHFFVRTNYN